MPNRQLKILNYSGLRRYVELFKKQAAVNYSRDLYKWLVISPLIGILVGLVTTAITVIILGKLWPPLLRLVLKHHWMIIPVVLTGFVIAGLIMQFFTPNPDEHSTEEIVHSYHEYQGDIQMRPFFFKLLAAIATVGFGGSAALEGPSIYAGGALGSWLWTKIRRFGIEPRDRRIMLISGAAAGMGAVFRAPLTGLVFAIEMPYKDDLAHEAILPSLISSVVAYATLAAFVGSKTLFNFPSQTSYTRQDLLWSALLGLMCGLVAMVFTVMYRRARSTAVHARLPHWSKLAIGGFLTGVCGLVFVTLYPGSLIPLGPNYEAVGEILSHRHSTGELAAFGVFKLAATLFSLGSGGVSAMFVPLFLTGGSFGAAFAQSMGHGFALDLYAAVGMAAFLAAGYKAPLTAVVFVAEATGGHSFIIPSLVGAAVAYAVSGESSASEAQRLHESVKIQELRGISASEVMQREMVSVPPSLTLREFADRVVAHHRHSTFPVCQGEKMLGTVSVWSLGKVPAEQWPQKVVREIADTDIIKVTPDCDVMEALRLLMGQKHHQLLFVVSPAGELRGIITKTDILNALSSARESRRPLPHPVHTETSP